MAFTRQDKEEYSSNPKWNDVTDTYNASTGNWNLGIFTWQPREVIVRWIWNQQTNEWQLVQGKWGTEESGKPPSQWIKEV